MPAGRAIYGILCGRMRVRRPLGLVLCAIMITACSGPGTVTHVIPRKQRSATFLTVTNASWGPIVIGSFPGVIVTDDAGTHWRVLHPVPTGARAMAYGRYRALISRGTTFDVLGLGVAGPIGTPKAFPFPGVVTSLVSDYWHSRIWAATPQPLGLYYSVDEGQRWWGRPAIGLCKAPLAMATLSSRKKDGPVRLLVACGADGIYESDDLGISFTPLAGSPRPAIDIATSFSDLSLIVVTTPIVTISRDSGVSWTTTKLAARHVALDPRNPDLLWAVGEDGVLYASSNGGESF
jgi:hypothetical protein